MEKIITPAELIYMIFSDEKKLADKDLLQIRLGGTQAESSLIYYTDTVGDERAVFLKKHLSQENLALAKSQILDTPGEKDFSFSMSKEGIKFNIFFHLGYAVCVQNFYGTETVLISKSKDVGLKWIQDFMKEIRTKEVQITNKAETGEKFEPFAEILNNTAIELERVLKSFRRFIGTDSGLQTESVASIY